MTVLYASCASDLSSGRGGVVLRVDDPAACVLASEAGLLASLRSGRTGWRRFERDL